MAEKVLEEQSGSSSLGEAVAVNSLLKASGEKVLFEGCVGSLAAKEEPLPVGVKGIKAISYKDKLLQLKGSGYIPDSVEDSWMTLFNRDEEGIYLDEESDKDVEKDPLCLAYQLSKEMHQEDCKKWRLSLIIKLLGKRLGTRFLMTRLQSLWNLVGTFELIEMDNGFLLIKFQDQRDYVHVLQEGPWVVISHYVVMQRWRPMFDPYNETVKKLEVWLRIPGLPIELFSSHHLWKIGNIFGKTLKVDRNSLRASDSKAGVVTEKARFTRIYVELDLGKSLVLKFTIGSRIFMVGYEGLHQVYFSYGQYGHKKDACVVGAPTPGFVACDA
ncbi:uncharacterized protein LOC133314245 [Gastrolobium bilobum]|uniref:uncharacterized protein LOC133314245 n=1 Tax=Gastrolobium bilobum TaxID=150636 RepID=UPI002AB067D3|nr:uncharacterized protein LOC133314245 [Gastrolobium bilobum]